MPNTRISADELFLRQALELAAKGTGQASPNPLVGALVVDERGRIVGSGTHLYAGVKHAEVLALEQAGPLARGNTLYLNLEPCSHTGRTGPCAEAIIAAGVARVVCSMEDPNPRVAGRGFQMLREAGIEVSVGLLEAEARRLNESFAQFIRTGLPFVTLKAAMTLDGKIAGPPRPAAAPADPDSSGAPSSAASSSAAPSSAEPSSADHAPAGGSTSYITGEAALRRVHQLRHASDAILVGVGTVLADDPLLTDRSGLARRRPLLRVVLDSRLRIPLTSRLVQSAHDDVIVFCSFAEENKRCQLEARGVRVLQMGLGPPGIEGMARAAELAANEGRPVLYRVLSTLGASQITSVLVEGGAEINWACLRARVVDKLVLFYTPKIFGPVGTVSWLTGFTPLPHDLALEPFGLKIERYDEDFAVECYLRDPYRPLGPQG